MSALICRFICKPTVFVAEGADHTGVDLYLKCKSCGARGEHHIECDMPNAPAVKSLRREWRKGAFA